MDNNKLDRYFAKKLKDNSSEPSKRAWDKLENALNKKNKKYAYVWYGVAASIALLFLAFWWISGPVNKLGINKPMAYDTSVVKPLEKIKKSTPKLETPKSTPSEVKNEEETTTTTITIVKQQTEKVEKNTTTPIETGTKATAQEEVEVLTEAVEPKTENEARDSGEKGVNMVFNLGDFKNTDKNIVEQDPIDNTTTAEEVPEIKEEEKKVSRFKKVLNFALEVKNGEKEISGIKEAKATIFKKNKKEKTTK